MFLHIAVISVPVQSVVSERQAMRTIENIGQSRFGIGCSYNEAACQSGRLYELQPLTRRGAHTVNDKVNPNFPTGSLNYTARALVLPQNVGDAVTDAQIDAAARWGAACIRAGELRPGARWYGHRDVTAKSCPGPIAYGRLAELNSLTRHYETNGLGEEDDMPLTKDEWVRMSNLVDGRLRDPGNLSVITDAVVARLNTDLDPETQGTMIRRTLLEMAKRGQNEALGAAQGDASRGLLEARLAEMEASFEGSVRKVMREILDDNAVPDGGV
jgi:hypothetical protein